MHKLCINDSTPFKKETSINNFIKNLKAKNLVLSEADLRR